MSDKPEDLLKSLERLGQDRVGSYGMPICAEAAAELRRLHDEGQMLDAAYQSACKIINEQDKKMAELEAVNAELMAALTHVADWFTAAGIDVPAARHARATIAKAEGT